MAKYGKYTGNQTEDFFNRIGGEAVIDRVLLGESILVEQPKNAKPVQQPASVPKPAFHFKVGRTVTLGLHKTPAEYRKALEVAVPHIEIGIYAGQILDKITISPTVVEVDLSEPFTIANLGFTDTTRYDAIKKRIVELGGELCPNEAGPADRLQYIGQPKGDWYRTAMEPLPGVDDGLSVFSIGHGGGGLYLVGIDGNPDALCGPGLRFVCVVPRKK